MLPWEVFSREHVAAKAHVKIAALKLLCFVFGISFRCSATLGMPKLLPCSRCKFNPKLFTIFLPRLYN